MSRSFEGVMKDEGGPKVESHKQGCREVHSLQPNIGSVRLTGLLKQYRRAKLRGSQSASDFRNVLVYLTLSIWVYSYERLDWPQSEDFLFIFLQPVRLLQFINFWKIHLGNRMSPKHQKHLHLLSGV